MFSVKALNGFIEKQHGEDVGEAKDTEATKWFVEVEIVFVPSFQVSSTVNEPDSISVM